MKYFSNNIISEESIDSMVRKKMGRLSVSMSNKKIMNYFKSGDSIRDVDFLLKDGLESFLKGVDSLEDVAINDAFFYDVFGDNAQKAKEVLLSSGKPSDELRLMLKKIEGYFDLLDKNDKKALQVLNVEYSDWISVSKNKVELNLKQIVVTIKARRQVKVNKQWLFTMKVIKQNGQTSILKSNTAENLSLIRECLKTAYKKVGTIKDEGLSKKELVRMYRMLMKTIKKQAPSLLINVSSKELVPVQSEMSEMIDNVQDEVQQVDELNAKQIRKYAMKDQQNAVCGIKNVEDDFVLERDIQTIQEEDLPYFIKNYDNMSIMDSLMLLKAIDKQIGTYEFDSLRRISEFLGDLAETDVTEVVEEMCTSINIQLEEIISNGNFSIMEIIEIMKALKIADDSIDYEEDIKTFNTHKMDKDLYDIDDAEKELTEERKEELLHKINLDEVKEKISAVVKKSNVSLYNENLDDELEKVSLEACKVFFEGING
jgi:hypothetical protein